MTPTTTILPGVKSIGWIDCDKLQRRVDLHGLCRATVPVMTEVTEVGFFDTPECRCTVAKESGNVTATATLRFHSAELLPIHLHLGFVVTDTNGCKWLIGSKEPPLPKLSIERSVGDPDGDGAGFRYEVTHVALSTMIPCIY